MSSTSKAKYFDWSMTSERWASVSCCGVIVVDPFVYVAIVGRLMETMRTVSPAD